MEVETWIKSRSYKVLQVVIKNCKSNWLKVFSGEVDLELGSTFIKKKKTFY